MDRNRNVTRAETSEVESTRSQRLVSPATDVFENEHELLLLLDVPGATKDGVEVELDKNQLRIEARRPSTSAGTALSSESQGQDYLRVFAVPSGIDGAKIEAKLDAGVLSVRLPKSEALKPRRIEVKAG